jgi:ribosomal protein L11 methyltransferase
MAFGTGHHATTRLVVRHLQGIKVAGKKVLDMGCGTGILGILAAKMGAQSVTAIDIDPWSYENGQENVQRNEVADVVEIKLGDASHIPPEEYELILANINRNVLFSDLPHYAERLSLEGEIILSGFFQADEAQMVAKATELGLTLIDKKGEENWSALRFKNN